jgi:predicted DNA-binding transcriptional regulator AlpA
MELENVFLTTKEAAEFLKMTSAGLEKYRIKGGGPRYHKLGHKLVRYTPEALKEWAMSQTFASTSDAGAA